MTEKEPLKQQLQGLLERWLKGALIDENIELFRDAIFALEIQNRKEWLEQKHQVTENLYFFPNTSNIAYQQAQLSIIDQLLTELKQKCQITTT